MTCAQLPKCYVINRVLLKSMYISCLFSQATGQNMEHQERWPKNAPNSCSSKTREDHKTQQDQGMMTSRGGGGGGWGGGGWGEEGWGVLFGDFQKTPKKVPKSHLTGVAQVVFLLLRSFIRKTSSSNT